MPKPYKVQDKYFHKAKEMGYRARSAFKLLEIQEKFHLLKSGQKVLDLGAAPGSFLQVISKIVGPNGMVIGVDLKAIEPFREKNIYTLEEDIFSKDKVLDFLESFDFDKVDLVTSDLAPNTSGIRDIDQGNSAELTSEAFSIAKCFLKQNGAFVAKIFQGADLQELLREVRKSFKKVTLYKPSATRDRSFETYMVAIGFKPDTIGT